METKDSFVLFFALLSALLFGCLAFSTLHNASQIVQLQQQLQQISECHNNHKSNIQISQQEILTKLISEVDDKVSNTDQDIKSFDYQYRAPNYRIRRRDTTNQDLNTTTTTTTDSSDSALEGTLTLLANALLGIVDRQLNAKLDCDKVNDATQCTILPGPKGEKGDPGRNGRRGRTGERGHKGDIGEQGEKGSQGDPGPRGPVGEKGDQGVIGEQGEKGEKGQLGYPGYKGEKGQMGNAGPPGPAGPQGIVGPVGPAARLTQSGCSLHNIPSECERNCYSITNTARCPVGKYVAGHGAGNFVCCSAS